MNFRLAAVDMDGTLLGPEHEISDENIAALDRLRARGIQIVLASGRPHANLLRFHRRLALSGPIVSGNGALVKVAETEEIWHQAFLPRSLAEELLDGGDSLGITQIWDGPEGVFTATETAWSEVLASRTRSPIPAVGDFRATFGDRPPIKILWIDDASRIAVLQSEMRARFAGLLEMVVTDPEYLEFLPLGVNKAAALEIVAARLGIDRREILAFGDGDNDVEMLRWVGRGITVDHARPAAKTAADRIAAPGDPATAFARAVEVAL